MTDLTDAELLEYIAGHCSDEQGRRVRELIDASPEIKKRYDELAAVYELLGQADVALPARDLWPDVARRLTEREAGVGVRWWARAAAAVLIAALAGHLVGRYGVSRVRTDGTQQTIADADVVEQLRLDVFTSGPMGPFGGGADSSADDEWSN